MEPKKTILQWLKDKQAIISIAEGRRLILQCELTNAEGSIVDPTEEISIEELSQLRTKNGKNFTELVGIKLL